MMRKFKTMLQVFIVICILVFGIMGVSAIKSPYNRIVEKYNWEDVESVANQMKDIRYWEIADEIKIVLKHTKDLDSAMAHAYVLQTRINDIPEDWFEKEISNADNEELYRCLLIELSSYKNNKKGLINVEFLKDILKNDSENSFVRQSALFALMNDKKSLDIIINCVNDKDDLLSFQALKVLNMIDKNKAVEISDQIIRQERPDSEVYRMAIKIKSYEYQENPYKTEEINNFIKRCIHLYETSEDLQMKETAIFALCDLQNIDAVKFIVNESSIDHYIKAGCVNQNYLVIKEMLLNNPTKENIDFAIQCEKIYAVDEVVDLLKTMVKKDKLVFDEINKANPAWAEQYYAGRR